MRLPWHGRGLLSRRQLGRLQGYWWASVGSVAGALQTFPVSPADEDHARLRELIDKHVNYCEMVEEFSDAIDWLTALNAQDEKLREP